MELRKKTCLIILILFLASFAVSIENVSAELIKEDIEDYPVGAKWEYKVTSLENDSQTMVYKMIIEITGVEKTEIDGIEYNARTAKISGEMIRWDELLSSLETPTLSFDIDYSVIGGTIYYYEENPDTFKMIMNIKTNIKEETIGVDFSAESNSTTISRILSGEKPDIIDIGSSWIVTKKEEKTDNLTMYGSLFDLVYGQGYHNSTITTQSQTRTKKYECVGKKTITVDAGTFETYEINNSDIEEKSYSLEYWTSEVMMPVKSIEYDKNGSIELITELISYKIKTTSTTTKSSNDKTPGFEILLIFCAIALVLFLKRKKIS